MGDETMALTPPNWQFWIGSPRWKQCRIHTGALERAVYSIHSTDRYSNTVKTEKKEPCARRLI